MEQATDEKSEVVVHAHLAHAWDKRQ